jgi:hypothetical protein
MPEWSDVGSSASAWRAQPINHCRTLGCVVLYRPAGRADVYRAHLAEGRQEVGDRRTEAQPEAARERPEVVELEKVAQSRRGGPVPAWHEGKHLSLAAPAWSSGHRQ